jgi:hypothetical protein
MVFTGISNISAQGMTTTITTTSNDTWQMQGNVNLTGTIEMIKLLLKPFYSKINIHIIDVIITAQNSVGPTIQSKKLNWQNHMDIYYIKWK